jgi:hypothetical protein
MTDAPRPADPGNWLARYLAWRRRPDPALARLRWAIDALEVATERAAVRRRVLEAERDSARRALAAAEAEVARLRMALEHYADPANWGSPLASPVAYVYQPEQYDDDGPNGYDVARAALTDAGGAGPGREDP